jgi:hypothetical protein
LIDGSALYMAARALYENRQLDYHGLVRLLTTKIEGLATPGPSAKWVMWTSFSPQNAGQARFLDFAENELQWEVRRSNPADSYIVEPSSIMDASQSTRNRLVRFDASIAFAIGRLAERNRIVVISDSFALSQPLLVASQLAPEGAPPVLAFFNRFLDSRWQGVLRREPSSALDFLSFDEAEDLLFGSTPAPEKRRPVREKSDLF